MSSPRVAAVVCNVIPATGEMLLGYRRGSGWQWPGGEVNAGELVVEGAVREIREECGIEVPEHRLRLVGTFEHHNAKGAWVAFLYSCWWEKRSRPSLTEPDKFREWRWWSWKDIGEDPGEHEERFDTIFTEIVTNARKPREQRQKGLTTHCFSCGGELPCRPHIRGYV